VCAEVVGNLVMNTGVVGSDVVGAEVDDYEVLSTNFAEA